VAIACGSYHTLALDSTGRVHAWGRNIEGPLGDGGTTQSNIPKLSFTTDTEVVQNLFINFTGQHRCFVDALAPSKIRDHEGLVVVTDRNAYSDGLLRGRRRAMAINQALPLVSLSKVPKDPRAFGVISMKQDHPSGAGASESDIIKLNEEGDIRAQINSIGEGCVWVCEEGGILSAGDYVTTSSIPGYTMQQLDKDGVSDCILKNYTVAKLTMDCDFSQPYVEVQEVKKDEYGNVVLDSDGSPVYETVTTNTRTVRDPATGESTTETLDVPVPVTEPAYEMRWLSLEMDTDGVTVTSTSLISKEEYEKRKAEGDVSAKLVRAAFLGCTYHCG
jgi:hypothetical protein